MTYLDVTSSCKSPVNTGVQRTVRAIWRGLKEAGAPITALTWDAGLATYCTLSSRELGFLENPFGRSGHAPADANPNDRADLLPLFGKAARWLMRRRRRVDLGKRLTAGDALFVPEIFQDNRIDGLPALAAETKARVVAVCHDAIAHRRPDITPPGNRRNFIDYLLALAGLHGIAAVSEETRSDLEVCWLEAKIPAAPVTVFPWPASTLGARRLEPASSRSEPSILCVGTLEPRKNHLVLLEAAELLWRQGSAFELVLIGRTTEPWGAQVLAAIDEAQAKGRAVRWLKHVDDATLEQAYADCAFTVFPSVAEGFGLPILESLWQGRPCVCGENGALGEVSSGGGCLTVDQTQAGALAAGMERLLNDLPYRRRLTEEARVRELRSWGEYIESVLPWITGANSNQL